MKNVKGKILGVIGVLAVFGIYYYAALPAFNIHSMEFWILLIVLLVLAAGIYGKIAKVVAMMTETEVEIIFDKACSNVISNEILEKVLYNSMKKIPLPIYSEQALEFANEMKKTISDNDLNSDMSLLFVSPTRKKQLVNEYKKIPMANFVVEYSHQETLIPGSSDVGDCSHVIPTAQFVGACFVPGTPAHSWQMVSQGKEEIAIKGMLYASKVLADASIKLIENPELIKLAKKEFIQITDGKGYSCPIPPEIKPNMNAKK